jgi:gliding motility-associated-like protein
MNNTKQIIISTFLILFYLVSNADSADPTDHTTWNVTANSYQYSMTVTSVLIFGLDESRDMSDKIAAFVGNDCRGVASPVTYIPSDDRYIANLMIYSDNTTGETVTIYLYDHSKDEVIEVAETLPFTANATFGRADDPYFALTTYDVTFDVLSAGLAQENAAVSLDGYGTQVTDVSGNVVFHDVQPNYNINYSVDAEGFDFFEDSVSLTNSSVNETVNLTLTKSFLVTNDQNSPLEGATVALNGYGEKQTGADGTVSFEGISENAINYTVSLNEYYLSQGILVASPESDAEKHVVLTLKTYDVHFYITDGAVPLQNASVTLNGYGTMITDIQGHVLFQGVLPSESIGYLAVATSFDNRPGEIVVLDRDVTKNIDLSLTAFNVTFSVINGETPMEGAHVTLDGYGSIATNVMGKAIFSDVALQDDIDYTISAGGFNSYHGSLSVVDGNVEEKITLNNLTYDVTFMVDNNIVPISDANIAMKVPIAEIETFDSSTLPSYINMHGDNDWEIDRRVSFLSAYSLKSGNIVDNQISGFSFEKETSEGEFSFYTKIYSEASNDFWSGNIGWKHVSYPISSGNHIFKWEYRKDGTQTVGNDCAWVDYIRFPSGTEGNWVYTKTGASGMAVIQDIIPNNDIYYSIDATGYDLYEDSTNIIDNDVFEECHLTITKSFFITDEEDSPLEGATVSLNGYGEKQTGADGTVSFKGITPVNELSYTVSLIEYDLSQGIIVARPETDTEKHVALSLTTYNVDLYIKAGQVPLENASVTLNGYGTMITDTQGHFLFQGVLPSESIGYLVVATSFDNHSGELIVFDRDVAMDIDLSRTVFDVTFSVINGEIPVEGAQIMLDGYGSLATNVIGEAVFLNVALEDNINYEISAGGFNPYQGSLSVVDGNVEEKITLDNLKYNVAFSVDNSIEPVSNANIAMKIPIIEEENFDNAILPSFINMHGDKNWEIDGEVSFLSAYSLKSGDILNNQTSGFSFEKETSEGEFSFYTKVYSEATNDVLIFYIDGQEQTRWSGNNGWQHVSYPISSGNHIFKWEYRKDGTQSVENDCAWVDYIRFPSGTQSNWINATTVANGMAVIQDIIPNNDIYYRIDATGYDLYEDSINIIDSDVLEECHLTITKSFFVTDEQDSPLEGATVSLNGYGEKQTGADGIVSFKGITPVNELSYTVSLNEYDLSQGILVARSETDAEKHVVLTLTTYDVDFYITDGQVPLENASVTLNGYGTVITDIQGHVLFQEVLPSESIGFSVAANNFDNYSGELVISDEDVTKEIDLSLTVFDVIFSVINGKAPIEGALVMLDGYGSLTTNVMGEAVFLNVALEDNINCEISAGGFNPYNGSLSVVDGNVEEKITLNSVKYDVTFMVDNNIVPISNANIAMKVPIAEIETFDNAILPSFINMHGDKSWEIDGEMSFMSAYALMSGNIVDNQTSGFSFEKETSEGEFSFYTKVFSEASNDVLIFYIDGQEQTRWSGNNGWQHVSYPISSGNHIFKWEYRKDGTQSVGNDCAWVDFIRFPSATQSNWINTTTLANGMAVIQGLIPNKEIYYRIDATGYDLFEERISVINSDVLEECHLTITKKFKIVDTEDKPLADISVELEGYGIKQTDEEGNVSFSGITPASSLNYSVSSDKYFPNEGTIVASNESAVEEKVILEIETFAVRIVVYDGTSIIPNASVKLVGYGTENSNDEGYVDFPEVIPSESLSYIISIPDYDQITSNFIVDNEDVVLNVNVDRSVYNATFNVIDGKSPIEGALVLLEGYGSKLTDVFGNVVFNNVLINNDIGYIVSIDKYLSCEKSIAVSNANVFEKVTLQQKKYEMAFSVDDGIGSVEGTTISIKVPPPDKFEDFSSLAVPDYFDTDGNNSWEIDNADVFKGAHSLKSGAISDNQFAKLYFKRKTLTGYISFYIRVSSEIDSDYLVFYIDGVNKGQWSGDIGWQKCEFPIEKGEHTFEWKYKKDGTQSVGKDCARIDYIQYPDEFMEERSVVTDEYGNAVFDNLLPHPVNSSYTIADNRYNTVVDSFLIEDKNIQKNVSLNINLTFSINKEFENIFTVTDSVFLKNYGKVRINEAGMAVFENVNPAESLEYKITSSDCNVESGFIEALYTNTINCSLSIKRYDVTFLLTYNNVPIPDLTVELETYGANKSNNQGKVIFSQVIPDSLFYTIDGENHLGKTGTAFLSSENIVVAIEILPFFNLHFYVESDAASGFVPVVNAVVKLTELNREQMSDPFGQIDFDKILPINNISFTVEAPGYESTTGEIIGINGDMTRDVQLKLIPELDVTNVVSPNGDGKNDYWVLHNPETYKRYKVEIFSTSGERIFSTNDYENNMWDGKYNGNRIPDGAYYYIMTSPDSEIVFKGIINLIY